MIKSKPNRTLDAITQRAIHDPAMREILSDLGLKQADPGSLRAAMDGLPADQRDQLLRRSEELEQTSGRSNHAYAEMGDFAQRRWIDLMREPHAKAKEVLKDMEPAFQAIRTGNKEAFEMYQERFARQGKEMTDAVAAARNELRRDIRRELPAMKINLDTETRAPLVDHLTRAATVPPSISEVMTATSRLEAAKTQHDLALEQRRHLGPMATPKASYDL